MPDPEIERLAGEGLRPGADFVDDLREQLVDEWRGGRAPRRRPWRMWVVAAAAVVAVIAAVAWVGTRDGRDVIVTPDSTVTPATSEPATSTTAGSPTAGIPTTVFGQLWVVTAADGVALAGPDLPTFTFRADDTIVGWDGCNQYAVTAEGVESTAAGCPDGVVPVMAAPPFTMTSGAELTTPEFQAEMFDKELDGGAAPVVEGHYLFGAVGGFTLGFGGALSIDSNGCEIGLTAAWSLEGEVLRFDLPTVPECYALDPTFELWLQQMNDTGEVIAFHGDEGSIALWTRIGDRVTRLVPASG